MFVNHARILMGSNTLGGKLVGSLNMMADSLKRDKLGQRTFHIGEIVSPGLIKGMDYIRDPRLNKGMAFTLQERQLLGIHGLIPPRFKSQDEQVQLCKMNIDRYSEDLNKYIYLVGLQDRNERLFYRLISEHVEEMMPIVYTPTVGLACQKFGLIYRRPRGLFITIHDKGHIYEILKNWPEPDVRAIVVTDGERILGLGDLGAYGMGIPVGKLSLYTALAGVKPHQCLPITLDVGTNTKELLDDPWYIGLKHKRIQGEAYDNFIDEFMQAVVQRYGQNTLIQFEDFANHNAFRMLEKYRDKYCTFNDDIQGTASVAVAGLIASIKLTGTKMSNATILFAGAGEAATGIANLIVMAMEEEGISKVDAHKKIWMLDSKGLLVMDRPNGPVNGPKAPFVKDHSPMTDFEDIVDEVKPTILIGASAQFGLFTPRVLKSMASFNKRPVIFALSNPTSKAECTAAEAYEHTKGKCVFASGSPFPKVEFEGKTYIPGQGNNAYIFPGVALAIICTSMHHIGDDIFLIAAQALAEMVTEKDLDVGRVYPPLTDIRKCSLAIAVKVAEYAYKTGQATTYPKPENMTKFVEKQYYDFMYDDDSSIPQRYEWPDWE